MLDAERGGLGGRGRCGAVCARGTRERRPVTTEITTSAGVSRFRANENFVRISEMRWLNNRVAKTSSAAPTDARGTRARAFGRSTPASPRVMLRSALLAACAFAACVSPATAYEVLVSEGVVAPRTWVAVASSPALGAGDGSDVAAPVPPVPGLITLAPGGALRVTRARPSAPAEREPRTEDVRAAVLTLGAVSKFDRPTSGWTLRVDVRSVETVEGVVSAARGGENLANLTRAVKTVERVVTTSCLLRRGSRGAWEVKKDGSVNPEVNPCTARRGDVFFSQSETKSAEETRVVAAGAAEQKSHDEGTHDDTETRIEIALGTDVWISRRDFDAIPSPFTSPRVENLHTKRVAARRVEEIALVAVPSDDAETYSRHTLAVNTLALLSRDDLVDLAWSWLARATQCASGLRTELVSKCDVGKEGATFSGDAFSFSENAKGLTVDAIVNGCCAAVASYADAGCGCALEVAEGLAPFFFGRRASSPGESAMARNDDVHAAAATLEALCFGGQKDEDEQKTSCVSSSATLAATRAVALENVQEEEPKSKARTRAFSSSSSPGTGTSPGTSPEEREYVAFKRWLDGADATPSSSTVVDADPDDVVTFGVEGETDAGGEGESDAQENANASRTAANGRRDEDEDEDGKKNAFLFFVALVVSASVAALITLAFFFRRRVFARGCRRDDLFLARANASDDAAFALENGDEVRLVARRRADAGAGGA